MASRALRHGFLLCLFLIGVFLLWMIPVLITGYPSEFPHLLLARNVGTTGFFRLTDDIGRLLSTSMLPAAGLPTSMEGRLSALVFGVFFRWITPDNLTAWVALNASFLLCALVFAWLALARSFGTRIAWIAAILMACVPVYARQAIVLDNYTLSFLFLSLSAALFVWLTPGRRRLAMVLAGIAFGLSISAKDSFIIFLPWILGAHLWFHRSRWQRALSEAAIFLGCALLIYLLPYIGDIITLGYPMNSNVALLWPGAHLPNELYLHLYPDPYTFFFDRLQFEVGFVDTLSRASFLERLQQAKLLVNFGLAGGPLLLLGNGIWLFVQSIPSYFQTEYIGTALLWLFVIPGFFVLRRWDRTTAWWFVGLVLSSEFLMRFVLHYERDHVMDTAWILILLAAIGIDSLSRDLAGVWKKISPVMICTAITLALVVQFTTERRTVLARLYRGTRVPQTMALSAAITEEKDDAVVAMSMHPDLIEATALLTDRTVVLFHEETVRGLLKNGEFRDMFQQYGVTVIAGYPDDLARMMRSKMPSLSVLPEPANVQNIPGVTPWMRYLLHVVR